MQDAEPPKYPIPQRPPTEAEQAACEAARQWIKDREAERPSPPDIQVVVETIDQGGNGTLQFHIPHTDVWGWGAQLCQVLGTTSVRFAERVLSQLFNLPGAEAKDADQNVRLGLDFIANQQPQSELETMLLLQAFATHLGAMKAHQRLSRAPADAVAAYGSVAVKLSRTFAQQLETLARLRNRGGQEIRVIHIDQRQINNVQPGGQAVIQGGGASGNRGQPDRPDLASLAIAGCAPLSGEDAPRDALSVAGDRGA